MSTRRLVPLAAPPDIDIELPGSKSISNRALLIAALADGTTHLQRLLFADDPRAMIDALGSLGVSIETDPVTATAIIAGRAGIIHAPQAPLDVNQSGTAARFLLPLALLASGPLTVDGDAQIRRRPQGPLFEALRALGVHVDDTEAPGRLPATVELGQASPGRVAIAADVSSQFTSGLLMVGPCLADGIEIEFTTSAVSTPYVEMTAAVMTAFGATVDLGPQGARVEPGGYHSPGRYAVEPDASSASYFFGAAAVAGGRVSVAGLGADSIQGDLGFVDLLTEMGAAATRLVDRTEVTGTGALRGIDADLRALSDTAPTLATVAAHADSTSSVTGIGFVRGKESDRIAAVVTELQRCGIQARDDGDGFTVRPGTIESARVQTYDDHRIAMAFAILGLTNHGIEIADPGCVAKTFPGFWEAWDSLAASGLASLDVLALDGPAGSGKSTVARQLAPRMGLEYLDTGAMYRSVTWAVLDREVDPADEERVADVAAAIEIDVGPAHVLVDGTDVTTAIRGPEVTQAVSQVSANPEVRRLLVGQQRRWVARRGGGVLEGRDIGTVVFPAARLKVYLTASAQERARRRAAETGEHQASVEADLMRRDGFDSSRAESPLSEASDAIAVDTTGLGVDAVVDRIVELAEREGLEGSRS